MKLRFSVDQAEAFRNGIDCPRSIVIIDVDPSTLPEGVRKMIADHMEGIDVCSLRPDSFGKVGPALTPSGKNRLVVACMPNFNALVEAVEKDNKQCAHEVTCLLNK